MGRYIVKLECDGQPYYLEWSTIVDAPVTYGMTLEEFKAHYLEIYGTSGMEGFNIRMERVENIGHSAYNESTLDELISCNRAGEKEKCLTKEEIIDTYIRQYRDSLNEPKLSLKEAEQPG